MGMRATPRALAAAILVAAVPALAACSAKDEQGDLVAGKQLFVQHCGSCHTLSRADTKGTQGPNLDEAFRRADADGFGESAIRGVVYQQILHPNRMGNTDGVKMPAALVTGDDAHDVASYVALVSAKSGKDTGLLATAVKPAGSGKPIAAADGVLEVDVDPGGQLAYVSKEATAPAGPIKIESKNPTGTPHDIVIDGLGNGAEVTDGGVSEFDATLEAGQKYTFYCSVPGHREAGMEGTLTVG